MKGAVSTIMMRVVHLVKNFGEFTAVGDISFEVAKGEIFAFLGPNGAGKTTTIKMLTTLLRPTSGRIELDGLDPESRNQLWTHVKHLNETQQVTVFLTTHYMDEADRIAHRIAIMDHGRIVAQGTPKELKEQTNAVSLEEAFLTLTGSSIRDEGADAADTMRQFAKMWSQKR